MFCFNCERPFADDEVVQKRDGETAMHIYCCPHCGVDDIGESAVCAQCGKELPSDEINQGFCLECLWDSLDYDTALAYLMETDKLCDFLLSDWLRAGKIDSVSPELKKHCEETFRRMTANDKLLGTDRFLVAVRYHILPYYPHNFGIDGSEFAEWYSYRVKNGVTK